MPDWIHSLVYIAIVSITAYLGVYYTQDLTGLIIGLAGGHFLASSIVKLLPGFWDN